MQISHESMREDIAAIYDEQQAIGYPSTFVEGAAASDAYMKGLFPDWQAQGITSVLQEQKGGYANNTRAMYGLARKAEAAGVRIISGVEVKSFRISGGAIAAIETDRGAIRTDCVVVAAGPWVRSFWQMLDLPNVISIRGSTARFIQKSQCGPNGRCRKVRSASIRTFSKQPTVNRHP